MCTLKDNPKWIKLRNRYLYYAEVLMFHQIELYELEGKGGMESQIRGLKSGIRDDEMHMREAAEAMVGVPRFL